MDEYVRIPKQTYQRLRLVFEHVSEGISIYEEFPETGTRRLLDCNERLSLGRCCYPDQVRDLSEMPSSSHPLVRSVSRVKKNRSEMGE